MGAARAVVEAGRQDQVVIVGMDHDQEALDYLRDGVIYALGVQDSWQGAPGVPTRTATLPCPPSFWHRA